MKKGAKMGYKLTSKITPSFDYENQVLSIKTEMEGVIEKCITEQVYFKDECVRKALIDLGWTPPPSSSNRE